MPSTPQLSFRLANGSTASTLCLLVIGLAGACAALPVLPEPAKSQPAFTATTRVPTREAQHAMMFPSSAEPYQAGGPGADDNTEWMPGTR